MKSTKGDTYDAYEDTPTMPPNMHGKRKGKKEMKRKARKSRRH